MKNHDEIKVVGILKHQRWKYLVLMHFVLLMLTSLTVLGQEQLVTLKFEKVNLEDVLKEIRHQTQLNYIFNHEEIPEGTTITIDANKEPVNKVLDECLDNTNLTYKIIDKVIIIIPKEQKEVFQLGQVIRGKVVDIESQAPLPFASVAILTTNPIMGSMTDEEGYFRVEDVPIGRHNIRVSFVGYEAQLLPELLVTTGKELVLNIKLKELVSELEEIKVKAFKQKDKPLNNMATVSARTFSVEEARRYAAGFDDPGRLAASFAGITTENSRDNTIVIRGNSPKGLLWRLEGVEISNPNHFANQQTFGGGGICAISALVMGNSDFFTGAFPAEYGNAMSGVFDIKLRSGNNEKYEHAFQIGTSGIDISSEGPLKKNSSSSYVFNYRYSTMGLVREIFPEDIKDFIPTYQDLSYKFNVPTKKLGVFSVWGLLSADHSIFPAVKDTVDWEISMDRVHNDVGLGMGALGLNHRYVIGNKSWLNTSFVASGDYMNYKDDILDYNLEFHKKSYIDVINYKYTFTSVFNRKFSQKHSNRTGVVLDNIYYNLNLQSAPEIGMEMISIAKERGGSNKMQVFTQSKFTITDRLIINAGLHSQYFNLNKEFVAEPRFGLIFNLDDAQAVSLAYGKHSRIEPLTLYFAEVKDGFENTNQPNKDLKVSKAHHFVFAYDINLNSNIRLKIEPYLQFLYDVPVIPDSNYSVLNLETEWFSFDKELVNTGTGKNMGIDVTLERFLQKGYYYLITASIFDSKYKGDNGIEYNTRFNNNYVFNLLCGKEWIVGEKKNKILGINGKLSYFGGRRTTPINQEQSAIEEDVVSFYTQMYSEKDKPKLFMNATINFRVNKKNHASILSLQVMNILFTSENYGYFYNYKSQSVKPWELAVPIPNLSYKIEF